MSQIMSISQMIIEKLYTEVTTGKIQNIDSSIYDNRISKNDLTDLLCRILTSNHNISESFIRHSDLICKIIPELEPCVGFWQNNKYHKHNVYEHMLAVVDNCDTDDYIIKLAALLHDIGKPQSYVEDKEGHGHFYGHPEISYEICKNSIIKRLEICEDDTERLLNLIRYHDITIIPTEKSVRKAYRRFGESFLYDLFMLKQADMDDHLFPSGRTDLYTDTSELILILEHIMEDENKVSLKNLNINGTSLINILGIKEGKRIGYILQTLLQEVLDNKIANSTVYLLKRASELNCSYDDI